MRAKFQYLNTLKDNLKLEPKLEDDFLRELRTHIEDKIEELKESGFSDTEASELAPKLLGSPRLIADKIYEVYSQGSWRHAFFAALPHFLVALLFVLRSWENTFLLPIALVFTIGAALYGWSHGRPAWLFPWLGYCLLPVVFVGVLLTYLPGKWAWIAALPYVPLAALFIISITGKAIKRDWLFASFMLFPVPIVVGWVIALSLWDGVVEYELLRGTTHWIAISFIVLSLTAAAFIRIKQRWAKAGMLLATEICILIVVALASNGNIQFGGWIALTAVSIVVLLTPAIVGRIVRKT